MAMDIEEICSRLRAGEPVADAEFDVWLPYYVRDASAHHWTQVAVAARVSSWLKECDVSSVLDVGSGAGKFCVVGALSASISFTGVEQRPHLVDAARTLANRFGVAQRAIFIHGELNKVDFRTFDALYFYNPFGENVMPARERLDESVENSRARFSREVRKVEQLLGRMPLGAHLVTYNGYGGRVPDSFELVRATKAGINMLRLWRKAQKHDAGGYWAELLESTPLRTAIDVQRMRVSGADKSGTRRSLKN